MRTGLKGFFICFCILTAAGCKLPCQEPKVSDNTTLITSACQLIEILNNLQWPDNDSMLPTTGDIQIQGTVTIKSYQLSYPDKYSWCPVEYTRCPLLFENEHDTEGIAITNADEPALYPVSTLTLTDVRLRFRTVRGHYMPGIRVPEIILLPPSDQSCKAGELRCAKDNVCYSWMTEVLYVQYWLSYCMSCKNLSMDECQCRDQDDIFSDNGTHCGYSCSDDNCGDGQCRGGVCVPADEL